MPLSPSSIETLPSASAICARPFGLRASNSSTTRGRPWVMSRPATPPVWKVRMVSWVPGSPIDWAAMIPTASPISTIDAGRHRDAVARAAHAGLGLALERRADRDTSTSSSPNASAISSSVGLVDLLAALQQLAAALGRELLRRDRGRAGSSLSSPSSLRSGISMKSLVLQSSIADDHVLGDVHQTAGQVAGVGGAQRRVGEALAGAVGGDEVLEHRQALHEVGLDRPLDDLALRVGHQAAHPGELADLLERSAGAGVGHHEDRVQLVEVVLHRLRDLVGGPVPERR